MDSLSTLVLIFAGAFVLIAFLFGRLSMRRKQERLMKLAIGNAGKTPAKAVKPATPGPVALVPGAVSSARQFSAWDLPQAPICTIYTLDPREIDRINANEDVIARLCPMLPAEARPDAFMVQQDNIAFKYKEAVGKPDAVFHTGSIDPATLSSVFVVEAKSRKLLNKPINMDFWKEIYQVAIAAHCFLYSPECDDFESFYMTCVLRYSDCIVTFDFFANSKIAIDAMEVAPIARRLALGNPEFISSTKLAHYCVTALAMNLGTTGVRNKAAAEFGVAFHDKLLRTSANTPGPETIADAAAKASNVVQMEGGR